MRELTSENNQIEYKEAKNSFPKEAWKTISAFANTKGGYLILGVSEKDGTPIVSGVRDEDKILKEFWDTINSDSKINLNGFDENNIEINEVDEKKVIKIKIDEVNYKDKPVYLNGQINSTYIRQGEGDYRANEEDIASFFRNNIDFLDNELIEDYTTEDLDKTSVESFINKVKNRDINNRYEDMSELEILKDCGVIRKNRRNKEENLTFGGLLFLGKYDSIKEYIPHFHLEYINKTNTSFVDNVRYKDRVATGDINFPNLNLFNFYFEVYNKIVKQDNFSFNLDENSMIRDNNLTKIKIILRETLANTIIHADYKDKKEVKIEVYNHYFDFFNPGEMRVSTREFFEESLSLPRNTIIETLFRKLGVCERMGSGGITILKNVIDQNLKKPEIKSENNETFMRIWKVDLADSDSTLKENEKILLKRITKSKILTTKEAMEILNLKRDATLKVFNSLIDKGYIEKKGNGRSIKYLLKENYEDELATMEHIFREIRKLRYKR
ncbi:RNA-binding domain-containing protein [Staphylococcus borealis]|uniref:RNA-binding domain-containing protein n=1 Tax=Staphylococcus borealis TaxID=2742203 RepID=UPI0039E90D83